MTNLADHQTRHLPDGETGWRSSSVRTGSGAARVGFSERIVAFFTPKVCLVGADLLAVALAVVAAMASRNAMVNRPVDADDRRYFEIALLTLPAWPVVLSNYKLYSHRFITRLLDEFRRIVRGCLACAALLSLLAFMAQVTVSRAWVVFVFVYAVALMTLERSVVRRIFNRMRSKGKLLRPVVVVGGNTEGIEISHMLDVNKTLGYDVKAFIDDEANSDGMFDTDIVRSALDAVERTHSVGVIIAATAMDLGTSNRLIRELVERGIHVELSSTLRDIASHRLTVRPLGRFPVVYVEPVQRSGWRTSAKRCLDVVLAGFAMMVSAPVMLAAAIAVKLDSKGPVLFKQVRVGRDGVPFKVLKFRTMVTNAEQLLIDLRDMNEADGPLFKMKDDPRVTRVGKIMRKFSIDELPQFINVLRNEMSMVGPRPALPTEVEQWGEALHGRLRVKPGITGMWQVNGRSSSSFEDYERLDLYYVDNWSLATDLAIVARTIPSVVLRRGAY